MPHPSEGIQVAKVHTAVVKVIKTYMINKTQTHTNSNTVDIVATEKISLLETSERSPSTAQSHNMSITVLAI